MTAFVDLPFILFAIISIYGLTSISLYEILVHDVSFMDTLEGFDPKTGLPNLDDGEAKAVIEKNKDGDK